MTRTVSHHTFCFGGFSVYDPPARLFQDWQTMRLTAKRYGLAVSLVLGLGVGAVVAGEPEFDGECVMGLALGKDIETDCSVNTVYNGRTYCFGNETAKTLFLKKPDEFLLQAHVYFSSKQPEQ
jgi:YHS domain-containing protein